MLKLLFLLRLLGEVSEDIVEDEVAIGLLSKNEGLRKALVRLALVGDLANDLDNDVGIGALGIDIGNADFGVVEVKVLDAVVDSLPQMISCCNFMLDSAGSYLLANANVDLVLLVARDELRTLVVEELCSCQQTAINVCKD